MAVNEDGPDLAQRLEDAFGKSPHGRSAVGGEKFGMPQRAALSFHAGIRTEPVKAGAEGAPVTAGAPSCRYLIVQGNPREEHAPGPGWHKLADVGRPSDKSERYRLYRHGPQ